MPDNVSIVPVADGHRALAVLQNHLQGLCGRLTPAQRNLSSAYLLRRLGIVHDEAGRDLVLAVKLATLSAGRGTASAGDVESALSVLAGTLDRGAFEELAAYLEPHDLRATATEEREPVIALVPDEKPPSAAVEAVPELLDQVREIVRAEATRAIASQTARLESMLQRILEALGAGAESASDLDA